MRSAAIFTDGLREYVIAGYARRRLFSAFVAFSVLGANDCCLPRAAGLTVSDAGLVILTLYTPGVYERVSLTRIAVIVFFFSFIDPAYLYMQDRVTETNLSCYRWSHCHNIYF